MIIGALVVGLVAATVTSQCTHERFGALRTPAADGSDFIAPEVGFAVVSTGTLTVRQGLLFAGGDFFATVPNNYAGVLVKHRDTLLLFDTGLGRNVAEQYAADMPRWRRPFFRYEEPVTPVVDQLADAGLGPVDRIVLSHAHWDHASGVPDFPGTPVWVSAEELGSIRNPTSTLGGPWPSQVSSPDIAWATIDFDDPPFEGFERSADLFDDGTVVLVPMYGHTPGSVGMFVRVDSGARYFFVGDVVWTAAALAEGRPKHVLTRASVDHDVEATQRTIEQIREVMRRDPELVVVPAHDGVVQRSLGFFPAWVK